jgi:hypothetical protein
MIILSRDSLSGPSGGDAVGHEVMDGLDVERLLDLGVRSDVKVHKNESGQQQESEEPSQHLDAIPAASMPPAPGVTEACQRQLMVT